MLRVAMPNTERCNADCCSIKGHTAECQDASCCYNLDVVLSVTLSVVMLSCNAECGYTERCLNEYRYPACRYC
jgi:hypothetical protein